MKTHQFMIGILMAMLFTSYSVNAQKLNLHAGYLMSDMRGISKGNSLPPTLFNDFKSKPGFMVGVSGELSREERWTLTSRLSYLNLGAKYNFLDFFQILDENDEVILSTNVDETAKIQYLGLLISVNYLLTDRLGVSVGPQASYQISYENTTKSGLARQVDEVNDLEFGILTGVNYQLNDRLIPSLNFYYGLTNVESTFSDIVNPFNILIDWKSRHSYFSFEVAYRIF